MPRRSVLRIATHVLALAALAGCASTPRGPVADDPRLASVTWDSATPAPEIARWIRGSCDRLVGSSRECVERSLYAALERGGISRAMGALDLLAAESPAVRADAHGYAHGLGIAAYRTPETLGRTFADCPATQMSGCYHGVIQGFFLAMRASPREMTPARLDAVCEEQRARSDFLFFQCTHGLGHGVMALVDNHLPHALETCDLLSDARVREDCYSGAFMENVIAATHPHHTAGAHASVGGHEGHGGGAVAVAEEHGDHGEGHEAHGAPQVPAAGSSPDPHAGHAGQEASADPHAGHGASATASDPHAGHGTTAAPGMPAGPWRALDRRDLHYPCSVVADRYKPGCYDNQAGAMLFLTAGNVEGVARECGRAPGVNARVCYFSLGRNVVAMSDQEPERAVALCGRAAEPGRGWCTISVATTMANLSGDVSPGLRVCGLVGQGSKRECYEAVGGMLAAAERDPARRAQVCGGVEAGFVDACRRGARLNDAPQD